MRAAVASLAGEPWAAHVTIRQWDILARVVDAGVDGTRIAVVARWARLGKPHVWTHVAGAAILEDLATRPEAVAHLRRVVLIACRPKRERHTVTDVV